MASDQQVSIFTTSLRSEFENAYRATAEPAPWEKFTETIPSTARIENYTWMSPSPGLARYAGHRRYGKIDAVKYSVENIEFDASFEVLLRDIEDDQTGGYMRKPKELAQRAKLFPGRWVLKNLALAKTLTGFDGTAQVANSHDIGTGDNLLSYNCDSDDSASYKLVALFHGGPLKPLLWQARKAADFETDSGSPESKKAKMVRYWIDMEGQMAFGYWWDMVWVDITDTPTVAEFQIILGNIAAAFRGFALPKSLTSEDGEYIHEQEVFSASNMTIVGSPALERIATQALNELWIPQVVGSNTVATTNLYKGWANFVPTNFLA